MDLKILNFKQKLIDDINQADLPMEVKRLVMFEIFTKFEIAVNDAIQKINQDQEEKNGQSLQ